MMLNFKAVYIVFIYTTFFFIVIPLLLFVSSNGDEYHIHLALIAFISVVSLFIGYKIPAYFPRVKIDKLLIKPSFVFYTIAASFMIFMLYSFYTFKGVPLFMLLSGQGGADELRGGLFKGRQGLEILLLYFSAIFTYVFLPLAILVSFKFELRFRWFFLLLSLLFCVSTLQKALLLNLLIPIFVYFIYSEKIKVKHAIIILAFLFAYFIGMIVFTGHGESNHAIYNSFDFKTFFSSGFSPNGGVEYFLWRIIAVPVYTAVDTLYVFENYLKGEYLFGGTSSMFSFLLGVPKVELEKIVFAYQFGNYSQLANANATFSVALFVDFSYIGVIVFSTLLGGGFRLFERSDDLIMISVGYLMAFKVLNAPLIGLFFSSGFLYFLFHVIFLRVKGVGFAK